MIETLTSYTWPTDGFPFASLGIRLDLIAARAGAAVRAWHVDGLGPARGFCFRGSAGHVFLLEELEYSVKFYGAKGPAVYVDAADLASTGAELLVDELVRALGLKPADVVHAADSETERSAADLVKKVAAARCPARPK